MRVRDLHVVPDAPVPISKLIEEREQVKASVNEIRGGEVLGKARAFIARGKTNAQCETVRSVGRGFLDHPHTVLTAGQVGRKLLEIADRIERESEEAVR